MATLFYVILKHIKYWHLNPDQDVSDPAKSPDPLDDFPNTNSHAANGVNGESKRSHGVHNV
jgi:hypothetical protein